MDNNHHLNCDVTENLEKLFTDNLPDSSSTLEAEGEDAEELSEYFFVDETTTIITNEEESSELQFLDSYLHEEEDCTADLLLHSGNNPDAVSPDLDDSWDFDLEESKNNAEAMVAMPEPDLLFDLEDLLESDLSERDDQNLDVTLETPEDQAFIDLNALLDSEPTNNEVVSQPMTIEVAKNEFSVELDELDSFLDQSTQEVDSEPANLELDLDNLASFLDKTSENNEIAPQDTNNSFRTFSGLEGLLDDDHSDSDAPIVQPLPIPEPQVAVKASKPKAFEETMRVAVKQLDNIGNLTGELVVRRNKLEENQKRLQQFLDSLVHQTQTLNDMGKRMQELYERSLLEGAIAASRERAQSSNEERERVAYGKTEVAEPEEDLSALELDRFTGFHSISQEIMELIVQVRESASDIQFVIDDNEQLAQNLHQVTSQLQEGITNSRMVPFAEAADRLPRAVRDISFKLNKQADLHLEGKEVSIDKMIIEHLYNPMTHLVNNAVTHGIEPPEDRLAKGKSAAGNIQINAFLQGNQTVITVSDDGAGIDPQRVVTKALEKGLVNSAQVSNLSLQDIYDFLFHPGFSTKDKADDFAGRGVGMDVVKTDLRKIRGNISIDSEVGKGTTFTIRLPLTLSICKALCCVNQNSLIAFPMDGVEGMKECALEDIKTNAEGKQCISWNGQLLPFQDLSSLLAINRQISRGNIYSVNQGDDTVSIVILRSLGSSPLAVRVDQVTGEQEIVIKQIEGPVPRPAGIAGATVLGDGTVMPIGDVLELLEIAQGRRNIKIATEAWQTVEATANEAKTEPLVLVVDDSITVRELLTLSFNKLGYRVEQARDGQEAWDKLRAGLPCDMIFCDIEMPRMNGLELLSNLKREERLERVPIAMLTSRGADRHRQLAAELGATAYLTKPYTEKDLIDVSQTMLRSRQEKMANYLNSTQETLVPETVTQQEVIQKNRQPKSDPTVLIVDDSITVRELLAETFKKAGYLVQQARNGQEAWDKLKAGLQCDAIICDIEMPKMTGLELLSHLQKDDELKEIPVAMLTSRGAEKHRQMAAERGAKGYLTKPYIEEVLLDTTKRLMSGQILLDPPD
jgi:chemotaxis protein histidine kinase CheA/DNA-binding response OmpR family regulator